MHKADKNGVATITTLKKVEEVTKKTPPELQEYYQLEFPSDMYNYWMDFLELNGKRICSESGHSPISFKEIESWTKLSGAEISQFWLDTIDMLDNTWLRIQSQK